MIGGYYMPNGLSLPLTLSRYSSVSSSPFFQLQRHHLTLSKTTLYQSLLLIFITETITTATWCGNVDGMDVRGGRKVMDTFYVVPILEKMKFFYEGRNIEVQKH